MTGRVMATIGCAKAVAWAADSGLLTALAEGPVDTAALARRLGCDARALRCVLDVVDAVGLTARTDDGRHALSTAACASAAEVPESLAGMLALFGRIDEFARTGRTLLPDGDVAARDALYPWVVRRLGERTADAARALARALSPARRILDVGAGSGVWSFAMAEAAADCVVTGLDLPTTCEVFRQEADRRGLGERTSSIAGDYHRAALPDRAFDRVVLANVLHLESPARAEELLARAAGAVAPGGDLVVVDVLPTGADETALDRAAYALHLALRVPGSRLHPREDLETWAAGVGHRDVRWIDLSSGHSAMVAS